MEAELPQHKTESLQITPELLQSQETGTGITAGCSALGVCTGAWAGLAPAGGHGSAEGGDSSAGLLQPPRTKEK